MNTTNNKTNSEAQIQKGEYVTPEVYEPATSVNSLANVAELMETRVAYCDENSLCEVQFDVNIKKLEMREENYRLNRRK